MNDHLPPFCVRHRLDDLAEGDEMGAFAAEGEARVLIVFTLPIALPLMRGIGGSRNSPPSPAAAGAARWPLFQGIQQDFLCQAAHVERGLLLGLSA